MYERLSREQERAAQANADISRGAFAVFVVALALVAAFSVFMILSETSIVG